jgi:hypothetical protein
MSKIQKIKINNFKSISDLEVDFKGCTAIVTAGNNKGKTSFLRGIPDRIRFDRPEIPVKEGEKEGKGEMTLDTGERFVWEFDTRGKDKLTYITNEGLKQGVTVELGKQFFPPLFDIDKFLQSTPKSQAKQLQSIIGLDFDDIDKRYNEAYAIRTERNREAELYHVKLEKMIKCDRVEFVDLTDLTAKKEVEKAKLNAKYLENKKSNEETRKKWNDEKEVIDKDVAEFNAKQINNDLVFKRVSDALATLCQNGYIGNEVYKFVKEVEKNILPSKIASDLYPKEPVYIEEMPDRNNLDAIDAQILAASETNALAQKYKEYIDHKNATEAAKDAAYQANEVVQSIENERLKMIESANMPKGISITSEGILVDGLPLDKNQISTSKLYCSALRIASMNLGEVKTLYFDASFLDKNSLAEIQAWANENSLQLLIERPDYDGGEIEYELIETI